MNKLIQVQKRRSPTKIVPARHSSRFFDIYQQTLLQTIPYNMAVTISVYDNNNDCNVVINNCICSMLVCTGRTFQLMEDLDPTAIITSTMWLVVQPSRKCFYAACYGLSHTVEFCSNYFLSIIKDICKGKTTESKWYTVLQTLMYINCR
jgi:hypothetical protein